MRTRRLLSYGLVLLVLGSAGELGRVLLARAGAAAASAPTSGDLAARALQIPRPVRYRIEAALHPEVEEVRGRARIRLENTSDRPLQRVLLHLYLNAFARPDTVFMRESGGMMRGSSADARAPGWIRLEELLADGQPAARHPIEDGTVEEVRLPREVGPGARIELTVDFVSRLPRVFARTGHADDFFFVGQWYPKPGVLRPDGSWHCPPFHARSEFFADFADFDVTLTVPSSYVVGATGQLTSRELEGSRTRYRYRASAVHDFAWTAWPHFAESVQHLPGVEVRFLSVPGRAGQAERRERAVREGLDRLQRWFGRYPYPTLTVVDVPWRAMGAANMEYPTVFTISMPWWAPKAATFFEEAVVHELTHQYFQGIVASNEVEDPWLDEGVTTYVAGLILGEAYGEDRSSVDLGLLRLGSRLRDQLMSTAPRAEMLPLGWPATRFPSWRAYGRTVYARAALLLATLESFIGRSGVLAALTDYARTFSFRHPRSADLERMLLARVPGAQRARVQRFVDAMLRRGELLDYSVRCGRDEVEVTRRGPATLPLELILISADASRRIVVLDGEAESARVAAPGLRRAELGPRGRLLLDPSPDDHFCVASGEATRWAMDFATALQHLLQAVGP